MTQVLVQPQIFVFYIINIIHATIVEDSCEFNSLTVFLFLSDLLFPFNVHFDHLVLSMAYMYQCQDFVFCHTMVNIKSHSF